MYYTSRSPPFWASLLKLIGHLLGTALIFVALFTIGWLVSVALHHLHGIHPFPEELFRFVTKLEIWLVYLDTTLSGVVLLAGMVRFCKDIVRGP